MMVLKDCIESNFLKPRTKLNSSLYQFTRIAQRRDTAVTKEVGQELDANKKLSRTEKDERYMNNMLLLTDLLSI